MKKIFFLALIFMAFNSCNKDDNSLPEPDVNEEEQAFEESNFKGSIDLVTADVTSNDIEVISYGENATILENGNYYFDSQRNGDDVEEIIVTNSCYASKPQKRMIKQL